MFPTFPPKSSTRFPVQSGFPSWWSKYANWPIRFEIQVVIACLLARDAQRGAYVRGGHLMAGHQAELAGQLGDEHVPAVQRDVARRPRGGDQRRVGGSVVQ